MPKRNKAKKQKIAKNRHIAKKPRNRARQAERLPEYDHSGVSTKRVGRPHYAQTEGFDYERRLIIKDRIFAGAVLFFLTCGAITIIWWPAINRYWLEG